MLDVQFRLFDGLKYLVRNNLVSVKVSKCITDILESFMLPSQLIDTASIVPVSGFYK